MCGAKPEEGGRGFKSWRKPSDPDLAPTSKSPNRIPKRDKLPRFAPHISASCTGDYSSAFRTAPSVHRGRIDQVRQKTRKRVNTMTIRPTRSVMISPRKAPGHGPGVIRVSSAPSPVNPSNGAMKNALPT